MLICKLNYCFLAVLTERFIVFQSFGQHGRELITSEVALRLLYILTEKRKISGVDLSSFERVLENLVIKVSSFELILHSALN